VVQGAGERFRPHKSQETEQQSQSDQGDAFGREAFAFSFSQEDQGAQQQEDMNGKGYPERFFPIQDVKTPAHDQGAVPERGSVLNHTQLLIGYLDGGKLFEILEAEHREDHGKDDENADNTHYDLLGSLLVFPV